MLDDVRDEPARGGVAVSALLLKAPPLSVAQGDVVLGNPPGCRIRSHRAADPLNATDALPPLVGVPSISVSSPLSIRTLRRMAASTGDNWPMFDEYVDAALSLFLTAYSGDRHPARPRS